MQWYSLRSWNTLRLSVPGWKVITNIGYVCITARVSLSVLLSCVIFTVWMSLAASSSRTSSSGTIGGMHFSTSLVMCGKLDWQSGFLLGEYYNLGKTLCKVVIGSFWTLLIQGRLAFRLPVLE